MKGEWEGRGYHNSSIGISVEHIGDSSSFIELCHAFARVSNVVACAQHNGGKRTVGPRKRQFEGMKSRDTEQVQSEPQLLAATGTSMQYPEKMKGRAGECTLCTSYTAQEWTCHTRAENNWVDSPRFGLVLNHGESRIASLHWKPVSIYNIFNIIKICLMKPR